VTDARAGGRAGATAGDPTLDVAADGFWSRWAAAHHTLVAELDALSVALAQAAAVFEGAERVTVETLAGMVENAG
jgi:hypothetical protein